MRALRDADPSAVALRGDDESLSFATLRERLQHERAWLEDAGVARCGVLADNGVAWCVADLALHLAPRLAVPLPGSFTSAQLRHAIDDAGLDTILTDVPDRVAALLPDWMPTGTAAGSGLYAWCRIKTSRIATAPAGTRKVTYTSGSTSAPKGVCLSGEALEAVAASLAWATRALPIERHLCLLPLATLLENVGGVYAPLLRGATCLVPSLATTGMSYGGLDVARLLGTVTRTQPHSLILVPELLQVLVTAAERGWSVPASLQFVAVGGARVSSSLLARADAVRLPVYEGYGLSECASVVCLNTPEARRAGTVGRPLPHVRVRVDEAGEVHVAGHTLLGYLGEERDVVRPEYATGDLGAFDADGYLHLGGRKGHRFITSFGRNVSPEWIEAELSQRLGGWPVFAHGEARPTVVALVGAATAELDDTTIDRAVASANDALPDYAQVRRWARTPNPFSQADGSLTTNGRLRRAEILARHAALLDRLHDDATAA